MIWQIPNKFRSAQRAARSLAVMGLGLTLLLAACGGGAKPGGGQAGPEALGTPVPFEPTLTPDPGPTSLDMSAFEVGGQTHQLTQDNLPLFEQAGMTWVKFQHKWEPGARGSDVAERVIAAHNAGLKVLLSITGPPFPETIDYDAYINFVTEAATYQPDGIEVWNEQNFSREWPADQVSGSSYVTNMLAPAYERIKSVNPNIMVISGAPTPTGAFPGGCGEVPGLTGCNDDVYVQDMLSAGAEDFLDCVGVHFNAGATSPSASSGHPADQGVSSYLWYYSGMAEVYGNTFSKPLCFTELGYVSPEGYGEIAETFDWGKDNTVAQQAQWLAETVALGRDSGGVRLIVVYNVDFDYYGPDDPQAGYAILRPDGSCPACDAIAAEVR